jgi:riboflavin kinase/FMN adenylyltransferase
MHIYYDTLDFRLRNTAIAIGVFDGVHLGHLSVLRQVVAFAHGGPPQQSPQAMREITPPQPSPQAEREQMSGRMLAVALTFNVHPSQILAPDYAPATISTLNQRISLIERMEGELDALVIEPFTREFAAQSPDRFVEEILVARLGVRHVFIGADFRYGKDREGTVETLTESGRRLGFSVTVVSPLTVKGDRVSSTRIRSMVAAGEMEAAAALLGHPFAMEGTVVPGKKLGRELGYPTANVAPAQERQLVPAEGVYAGYAVTPLPQPLSPPGKGEPEGLTAAPSLTGREIYRAAISVGTNPTTDGGDVCKIEAFLMDGFHGDLYGRTIELAFHSFLRGQIAFDGLEPLKLQIAHDVNRVAELLPPVRTI